MFMFGLFEDYLKDIVHRTKTHNICLENTVVGEIVKVERRLDSNSDGTVSFMVTYIPTINNIEDTECADGYLENVLKKLKNKNNKYIIEAVKEKTIISKCS